MSFRAPWIEGGRYAYGLDFCSSNISTNEALTIPVGTATTPIPTKDINVPNNLPPIVFGNIYKIKLQV